MQEAECKRYVVQFILVEHGGVTETVLTLESDTPFPAISRGDYIDSGCFPPLEVRANKYEVREICHSFYKHDNGMRLWILVTISVPSDGTTCEIQGPEANGKSISHSESPPAIE